MKLLVATTALVLSATPFAPAMAAAPMGFAGALSGAYGSSSCDGCDSTDAWSIGGSGAFGLGMRDFGAQLDASYNSVSDVDVFGIGGSLFWAPVMGRAGATIFWATADESGVNVDGLTYGVFGEYYAGNAITIAAKGGGLSLSADAYGFSDTESGGYIGGALTGYVIPNLAIQGDITFSSVADLDTTTYGIGAEFLVSDMVPIAIFGGYSRSNVEVFGFDADVDTWMIGLRFYAGAAGPTLVDKHRNGTLGWAGATNVNSLIAP
jgi:hypothetical protein